MKLKYEGYDKYTERMQRLSRILLWPKRNPVKSIVFLCVILVVTGTLFYVTGMFTEDIVCRDIIYGEKLQYSASALFSEVKYEFLDSDEIGGKWESSVPISAGNYKVRAVTENALGIIRYSTEKEFKIGVRQAFVYVNDFYCQYGDVENAGPSETVAENLASGDYLTDVQCKYEELETKKVGVSIESFSIKNKKGEDMTESYSVVSDDGIISITERNLSITTESAEKEYDGTPLINHNWKITSGSLADGDSIIVDILGMQEVIGYSSNSANVKVINESGADVSEFYKIEIIHGILRVKPISLKFISGDAEKVYNGLPLTNEECSKTAGEILDGHFLEFYTTGVQIDVGESHNYIRVFVYDEDGNIVTNDYYDIMAEYGTLNVLPKKIGTVQSGSAEKVFDGKELIYHEIVSENIELEKNHTIQYVFTGTQTLVGSSENTFRVLILNEKCRM